MKVRISVTQKDIDGGNRGCGNTCAVSLALARRVYCLFRVAPESIIFYSGSPWNTQEFASELTPTPRMGDFIQDFDRGKKVRPTSFVLDIPENLLLK